MAKKIDIGGDTLREKDEQVTPDYEKILYAPDRVARWIKGEITMQELHAISGPEMLEMAMSAFALYEQGKYKDAKAIFRGLANLDPSEAYYATALGAVSLAEENLDEAKRLFDEAIRLNKDELPAYVNRGEVYLRQGKVAEAAMDFKKAVELDPEGKDPLSHRARLLAAAALEAMGESGAKVVSKGGGAKAAPAGKPAAKSAAPVAKKK